MTASIPVNPFRPTRWEHHSDGLPLIWFTPTADQLSGDKSAYVYGSRGSGKTSLLRSICWEDLLTNPSLKLQRSLGDSRHIGIYIRLPDHISGSLSYLDWKLLFPNLPDPHWEFFRFFSLAIELICVEKAVSAAHSLRLDARLQIEAGQELRLVAELLEEYQALLQFSDQPPKTFSDLARLCRNIVRRMNEASGRGNIADLVSLLPSREPYDLLNFVVERLSGVTRLKATNGSVSPGFKFCLDDCEVLNLLQQRTINTLVRKSRFPISWVICSVGDPVELGDTFIPQQPLTDADRRVLSLNARERPDFFLLCQAVASLRAYFSLPKQQRPNLDSSQIATFFDLDERLGHQDVNETIATMLSRSTKATMVRLLTGSARLLRDALIKIDSRSRHRYSSNSRLPYYETYLLLHWNGADNAFNTTADETDVPKMLAQAENVRNSSFNAWMRRKMVAALFHLASRLGFKRLPIAGANIIISLSDGSIRDFLEIMAEIYDQHVGGRGPSEAQSLHEKFALGRTKLAFKTQNAGIYRASDVFFQGISAQTDPSPQSLVRVIDGLGKYTSLLQTNPDDPSVLGRAERGVFYVDYSQLQLHSADAEAVAQTLRLAELAGYLRATPVRRRSAGSAEETPLEAFGNVNAYRLHRRFAPHFRFSYRGAYEPVRLPAEQLAQICRVGSSVTTDVWVKALSAKHPLWDDEQLLLPLPRDFADD